MLCSFIHQNASVVAAEMNGGSLFRFGRFCKYAFGMQRNAGFNDSVGGEFLHR